MDKICPTCLKHFDASHNKTRFCSIFCFHDYPRKQERETGKKKCGRCLEIKNLIEFSKRNDSYEHKGFRGYCKQCEVKHATLYRKNNLIKIKKRMRKWMMSPKGQYKMYKNRAEHANIVFELNAKYFESNQLKHCYYCGSYNTDALRMGIDRRDSTQGYLKNNCVPCCTKCNLAKFTHSQEDFLTHIDKIYNYQHRKEIK